MIDPTKLFNGNKLAYSIGILTVNRFYKNAYCQLILKGASIGDSFSKQLFRAFAGQTGVSIPIYLSTVTEKEGSVCNFVNVQIGDKPGPIQFENPDYEGYKIGDCYFDIPDGQPGKHLDATFTVKENGFAIRVKDPENGKEVESFWTWPHLVNESAGSLTGNCDPAAFKGGGNEAVGGDTPKSVACDNPAPKSFGMGLGGAGEEITIEQIFIKGEPLPATNDNTFYVAKAHQQYLGMCFYQSESTEKTLKVKVDEEWKPINPDPSMKLQYIGKFSMIMPPDIDIGDEIKVTMKYEGGRVVIQPSTKRHGNLIPVRVPILLD